ncbi:hypothetical protein FA10DRAFT_282271 [Acaromyces ingoldii]|uniref:Uncharacterized protein n=1 Tax=Acaromyces ingoldii TaxID=215250 RepID=A0A316YAY8_9BASI|nr:hypothetical protein FA10DRAFT_282271 [Acaromyces ingoldii]PWN86451.1 hypothetical protein FA10DRAFT_282271 [Acaromyces ingoldii]
MPPSSIQDFLFERIEFFALRIPSSIFLCATSATIVILGSRYKLQNPSKASCVLDEVLTWVGNAGVRPSENLYLHWHLAAIYDVATRTRDPMILDSFPQAICTAQNTTHEGHLLADTLGTYRCISHQHITPPLVILPATLNWPNFDSSLHPYLSVLHWLNRLILLVPRYFVMLNAETDDRRIIWLAMSLATAVPMSIVELSANHLWVFFGLYLLVSEAPKSRSLRYLPKHYSKAWKKRKIYLFFSFSGNGICVTKLTEYQSFQPQRRRLLLSAMSDGFGNSWMIS